MKVRLLLLVLSLAPLCSNAEPAFDANAAKNALRALHQQFVGVTDPAQRARMAKSIMERTTPLIKEEPEGLGGWLMHAEAAIELKDQAACALAVANLLRLHAETSTNPLAASVMRGLQTLGTLPTSTSPTTSATKDNPLVNTLGMKFVPLPNTKVLMCIHETRKRDYLPYFKSSGSTDDEWLTKINGPKLMIPGDDYPVAFIKWDDANGFCTWLSTQEHRKYRLCTDHEWSCATGLADEDASVDPLDLMGKHPGVFPWGSGFPPKNETANIADDTFAAIDPKLKAAPGYHDGHGLMAPVMSFPPNALGIYDLAGNVAEWTLSLARAGKPEKVVRGSSWSFVSESGARSDYRSVKTSDARGFTIGFRVVLEQDAAPVAVAAVVPAAVPPPAPPPGVTPPKANTPPAKPAAPLPVKERLKPQANGDLMLVGLPTVDDTEGLNDIDIYALVWMKKYHGWKADVPKIVQRHKLDLTGDYDMYGFMTGTFAKDAHVRLKASRTFDKNDAIRALKKGNPILVWRYYRDDREAVLRNFAQQHKSDPQAKLPDGSDADEKKKFPKYDKLLDDKGERVTMASIIYGYNEKREEFIFMDPMFGDEYQLLWITSDELKATVYDMFVFE